LYTRGALVTHNTIIQTLSETGILGFVPFMLLIGVGLFHMRTLGRSPDKPIASMGTAIEVGLWGLVVCGMSGGYVVTWFPYLLLGLAGAARRMARENAEEAQ
jgi:O-antigen ligase